MRMALFDKQPQYNDNGDMLVNQVTLIESGTYTEAPLTPSGSIASMYDIDDTNYYQFYTIGGSPNTDAWIKWDMGRKVNFKNIIAYVGTNSLQYLKLQGSKDNSAWTDLASTSSALANFVVSNVSYRYIRFYALGSITGGAYARVHTIKATT